MLLDADQNGVFDEVANARKRTITIEEHNRLVATAPSHVRGMLIVGMIKEIRPAKLRRLRWYHIDRPGGFIRFPADATITLKRSWMARCGACIPTPMGGIRSQSLGLARALWKDPAWGPDRTSIGAIGG
jgi:hypothetical protein